MKKKFLLALFIPAMLQLSSCTASAPNSEKKPVSGSLQENEALYVYLGNNLIRSFALENQSSQIHGDIAKCHELKYVYTWDSLTLDFAIDNSFYTEYYCGNNISIIISKLNSK